MLKVHVIFNKQGQFTGLRLRPFPCTIVGGSGMWQTEPLFTTLMKRASIHEALLLTAADVMGEVMMRRKPCSCCQIFFDCFCLRKKIYYKSQKHCLARHFSVSEFLLSVPDS